MLLPPRDPVAAQAGTGSGVRLHASGGRPHAPDRRAARGPDPQPPAYPGAHPGPGGHIQLSNATATPPAPRSTERRYAICLRPNWYDAGLSYRRVLGITNGHRPAGVALVNRYQAEE